MWVFAEVADVDGSISDNDGSVQLVATSAKTQNSRSRGSAGHLQEEAEVEGA
jgi:hypothetical protein